MKQNFERKLENLKELLLNPQNVQRKVYEERNRIIPMLVESEKMTVDVLLERAWRIKPLMRICKAEKRKADPEDNDKVTYLVFTKPVDLRQSYYYGYSYRESTVFADDGRPLPTGKLQEAGRFICYHRYGGYWMFLRPGVDEVLQQLPAELDDGGDAVFEVRFASLRPEDVFNAAIDRHVSEVIVYRPVNGLPEEVKRQPVIVSDKTYLRCAK